MKALRVGLPLVLLALGFLREIASVDRNNFKSCEQSSFCRRLRRTEPDVSKFEILPGTLQTYKQYILLDLQHSETKHLYVLKLSAVRGGIFHFQVDEKSPLSERYRVVDALAGEPEYVPIKVQSSSASAITVSTEDGTSKAVVNVSPFRIDFYKDALLVVSANSKGLMRFEHLRRKETSSAPAENEEQEAQENENQEVAKDPGTWEENFKSHHDSKPKGPEALSMDFSFPQGKVLYGIPEHADSFVLKQTVSGKGDPYRLYNLDVFEYELDNGMALYGAVPVIYGTGPSATAGVFWQNAAETWVDIFAPDQETNVMSSIVNFVSRSSQDDPPAANFISESGIIDVFVFAEPSPLDAFRHYTDLTGKAPLPQLYAIAYHQCRWNYNDEQDVTSVSAKFDEHDIPMDTMWLDIEYTDSKKYFTWDHHKFPHPLEMIRNLTEHGRHLTIIIDPHIKRDGNYFFHNDCTDRGYYVKNKDGNDYEGWCWPGAASYADFFNPEVRKYYADQYLLENFKESTKEVGIWNDMNEPSVFNGPEITMLKDNIHYGGWEHRDVHNLYGHMHILSTYEGLVRRGEGNLRPFILTRSHFAGSQRYAAVWTGDNMADWGHMQASIKMCLSLSVAGISFCGADVGGFFGNPDSELFYRWYQIGAFQPFFRSHAHIDTKRREPWLYPEDVKLIIRDAIRKRYRLLPLWYTMFYEHERSGLPIMRPMLAQYPSDVKSYALDTQFMLSDKLLVAPVLKTGQTKVDVYFPTNKNGESDYWYDADDNSKHASAGYHSVSVDSYKVPVYQRGGTIVPHKDRIRRAATLMKDDPYTLVVALDKDGHSKGTLYIDDETSFEYRHGKYMYIELEFKNNVLSSKKIDETASYATKTWLERVILVGLSKQPKSATLYLLHGESTELNVYAENNAFIVRKPGVSMVDSWSLKLNY
ncbi:neutral alpha-glucosidase AB [Toxorhynchites rutilus septentrionalis]|uniref:neutral alpha-glucosidase AB n=1 Tax=Toxorhynchites rutilus septentrionalis TaxID=329112 RepID=UPI002478CB41|nr:neutral alpha-glucosidase AB [Toxorhynchites rutilus septentrionalis]